MAYLSFFQKCLSHLIPRIAAVYSDPETTTLLYKYKDKFDNAISEIQQSKIMDAAMELFSVSMWIKDIDSNFLYHNYSCREIILSTAISDGLLFLKDNDFIDNALARLCLHSDKEVLKRKKMLRFVEKAVYTNGESKWLDICKAPTFSPSGRISGTMGTGVLLNRIVSEDLMTNHNKELSFEIPLSTILTTEILDNLVAIEYDKKKL